MAGCLNHEDTVVQVAALRALAWIGKAPRGGASIITKIVESYMYTVHIYIYGQTSGVSPPSPNGMV